VLRVNDGNKEQRVGLPLGFFTAEEGDRLAEYLNERAAGNA